MNAAQRIATLVPLTGLIPLGYALLATFIRSVPVVVRSTAVPAPSGTDR